MKFNEDRPFLCTRMPLISKSSMSNRLVSSTRRMRSLFEMVQKSRSMSRAQPR